MSIKDRRRKRVLIVERDFQFRFTIKILLVNGLLLLVFGGLMLFIVRLNYEMLIRDALVQMPDIVDSLRRELRTLSLTVSAGIVLILLFMFLTGLYLTQKIAGPLFAFKRRLKEFATGSAGVRLKLRQGDELQNLEELFNEAMEYYDNQLLFTRQSIQASLEDVENKNPGAAKEKLKTLLQKTPEPKIFRH